MFDSATAAASSHYVTGLHHRHLLRGVVGYGAPAAVPALITGLLGGHLWLSIFITFLHCVEQVPLGNPATSGPLAWTDSHTICTLTSSE